MQEKHERTQPSQASCNGYQPTAQAKEMHSSCFPPSVHGSESLLSQNTHTESVGSTVLCAVVIDVRDANVQDEDQ